MKSLRMILVNEVRKYIIWTMEGFIFTIKYSSLVIAEGESAERVERRYVGRYLAPLPSLYLQTTLHL